MSVFTPVIRLPPKRKPSLARSHSNNSSSTTHYSNYDSPDPKEFLVSDTLFLSKLPDKVRESDIRTLLQHCMPIEIVLDREKDIGQLRFSHPKYADRAYSLYNGFKFTNSAILELQMYQDKRLDPEATAVLLEINGLPDYFDDNKLYDVFRPFGPLDLCKCVMKDGAFRGTAFIQFFNQHNSDDAETHLHGHLLDGHKLSVVPFMPSKPYAPAPAPAPAPPPQKREEILEETPQTVDIMNLYIKNLEPHITNQDLNQAFRKFGRIISARVMTNPATGQSKGYGFVSFGKSEEAAAALQEMNGAILGNRPLTVAYHEPRKGRGNTNNHSNNSSNNNTPIPNYQHPPHVNKQMNENNNYYNYNSMAPPQQQQSYYIPDQRPVNLSSTTPINGLGIDNVDELGINMNLRDLSIGQKPVAMHAATINLPARKVSDAPHINSSPNSGTSTGKSLISLASGLSVQQPPPSMPHPVINYGHNGRPTLRRRGSLESVMTESSANIQRIKLEDAVRHCGDYGKATGDIVDMLLTLKRKERSLCLFNPDFLRDKVQLALEALATCNETDSEEEEEEDVDVEMEFTMRKMPSSKKSSVMMLPSPTHQQPYYNPATSPPIQREHNLSPPFIQPVKESKAIPIIAPPSTIVKAPSTKTASLTKENLMNNNEKTPEPSSASPIISSSANKEIEELLVSLEGKPIHERKQLLGDKLFPLVKSTGTKQAPKVTIYLLDTVDLHELANIMYDTPSLKMCVEEAFESLQQQQQQQQ
ncbi:uncharacterized protein B0P05DRAFT_553712 [Gilbertella persicaria]|uniref:uncharacterized protein n=1 Tax=Gilbertella persicaria TaxID=101096 RepID=UPI002220C30A|nr:uncharacterized protein B0P05DRAFT_553712 [Gilbertella persicaria]KAI8066288.1 hypothetical protein B0P05DRAFT_553712 [Gilbertella persicaria]